MQVIQTSGHTPGHISLCHTYELTFIANDTLVYESNRLDIANPQFALDLNEAVRSVEEIYRLPIKTIHSYHRGILTNENAGLLNDLVSRYRD